MYACMCMKDCMCVCVCVHVCTHMYMCQGEHNLKLLTVTYSKLLSIMPIIPCITYKMFCQGLDNCISD